ncbi:MAG: DUF1405 domain-containing protein [bacterium]
MGLESFFAWANRFKLDGRLLLLIALADVAGIVGGWYYYADVGQFDLAHPLCGAGAEQYCTPFWAWPLVADSPNAVLVIFAALLLYRFAGWRSKALDAAAFTLNIYVGLWTTALFLSYSSTMGTYAGGANTLLFVTHMGMPLQSLILTQDMRRDKWSPAGVAGVLALLALFVAIDYWGPHWHPAPFVDARADDVVHWGGDALLKVESVALMLVAAVAWLVLCRPLRGRGPQGTV